MLRIDLPPTTGVSKNVRGNSKRRRILIVDDELRVRELLSEYLIARGFDVETVNDGESGLELMQTRRFHLVLVDLRIPGLGGMSLVEASQSLDPSLPCIVMTGFATVESAIKALQSGASDYLVKPFPLAQVYDSIENALKRHERANEALVLQQRLELYEVAQSITRADQLGTLLDVLLPHMASLAQAQCYLVLLSHLLMDRRSRSKGAPLIPVLSDELLRQVPWSPIFSSPRAGELLLPFADLQSLRQAVEAREGRPETQPRIFGELAPFRKKNLSISPVPTWIMAWPIHRKTAKSAPLVGTVLLAGLAPRPDPGKARMKSLVFLSRLLSNTLGRLPYPLKRIPAAAPGIVVGAIDSDSTKGHHEDGVESRRDRAG